MAAKKPKSGTTDSRAPQGGEKKIKNWADEKDSEAYAEALRLYPLIQRQYQNQQERDDRCEEFWAIYNGEADSNQQYAGNSQGYVPAVRDCVNARAKRALKQLFPVRYRHVEAVGTDAETPFPQLSLLEHYIRQTNLKDIVRSDLVAGDVTGQWNLYIDWTKTSRTVTNLVKRNPIVEGAVPDPMGGPGVPLRDPTEEKDELETEEIIEGGPDIVDFATEDLAVIPPTCNDIEKSEASCMRLRMSRSAVQRMVDEGVFLLPGGDDKDGKYLSRWVQDGAGQGDGGMRGRAASKQRTIEAGIQTKGTTRYLLAYETAAMLDFGDKEGGKQLGLIYYAGPKTIVGIIKAPWWGGKRPVISAPVERVQGSFFGRSKIEPVKFLQWNLTDFWNMGQDSAMYSLLPVVMTDPLSNPNYASMVIGLAAVWSVDPNKTKMLEFPQLWKESAALCEQIKRQIWESMDVNEMMMGRMPQGRKNNQMIGAVQQEQMVAVMDHAERYEEVILNPLVERMFEYDCQFRTESLTIKTMGEIGVKAKMQEIEPQQWGMRYFFQWAGTSMMMGQQRMQQMIAGLNVLRGVPPQLLNGRKLDITPILEFMTEQIYGPEIAPRILIDQRNLFTVDAKTEDEMMHNNLDVMTHQADNDVEHIQQHQLSAQLTGDPNGRYRAHIAAHMGQLQAKRDIAMQGQKQPQGQPGVPGPSAGGPAVPGVGGTPRQGAQPGALRSVQNPPGAIGPDQMQDAAVSGRG